MERLVTTSQAAEILGLSLQGIHYRIKKNQLKSIKKSGKIFVYITDEMEKESITHVENKKASINTNTNINDKNTSIIEVKNEQILLLRKSLKWMKKQYISEINRLEKNQENVMDVLKSEIKLLQSAFNEMRSIYKPQIAELQKNTTTQKNDKTEFISLKDFSILMKRNHKSQNDIKLIILTAIKNNDRRFIYNKKDKKLLIVKSDFKDLL
ncbi:helix-turn-helix domain-containing protein [Poseidonibacter antarcticus]|uniref:helix-turn-helix domain-containing protein n=1 Tax=Poseidonibacter antarcticus TaxID=2478538 RepID=UPI000EF4AEB9|nr:helix-turn-helix domain-containing protein [Poseidonibacter antarcticus]